MSVEFAGKVKEGRTGYVLVPLLLLHLTLISLQVEDPAGTLLFRRWVLEASSPFLKVSSNANRELQALWTNYVWLHGAREENYRLHKEVEQLGLRQNSVGQLEAENLRLRNLLDLKQTLPFATMGARVVGRSPNYLAKVLYIDRGSQDGVLVDSPVVSGTSVVGRTILVAPHTSQVQLITNVDASLGVMIERSRSPGVLEGSGNHLLDLNYINNSEQVDPEDIVVTSGLDEIFPKGLRVGRVVDSHKGKSVFRVIRVEPFADLLKLEEVLVLINPPRAPAGFQAAPLNPANQR